MRTWINVLLVFSAPLWADEVNLKNGNHLSGQIARLDDKELTLKTDFAGDIKIRRDALVSIATAEPVNVTLRDGQNLFGHLRLSDATLEVATETDGTIKATEGAVVVFRSKPDQDSYLREIERQRNPRLTDLWTANIALGYAQARGNASTNTSTTSGKLLRKTARDLIDVHFNSLYSNNRADGQTVLAANAIRGGVKYDFNISTVHYAFGSTDLEFDRFQNLDLRIVPAGGVGRHWIKNKSTIFDTLGGFSLNRESFSTGLTRDSTEFLAGNELQQKLGSIFSLTEKATIYVGVSGSGAVRINGDLTFSARLLKWLSWQILASDRYISNPLPGRRTNDTLVTTGLRIVFTR